MKRIFYLAVCLFVSMQVVAQDSTGDVNHTGANALRADGKIYVVMAVVITILLGLIIYLIRLDRKISKMEGSKPVSNQESTLK